MNTHGMIGRDSRRTRILPLCLKTFLSGASLCAIGTAWSQTNGTWTGPGSGNWNDPANWNAGAIASGGGTANFGTLDLPAGIRTVTVDAAHDVSVLTFGDTDGTTAGTWSLALGTNLTLSGSRAVTTGVTTSFTGAFGAQAATDMLDKQGDAQLNLTGLTTAWPGPMKLGAGTVRFRDNTSSKATVVGALTGTGTVLVSQGSTRTFTQESDISGFMGRITCTSGNFRYANGSGNPTAEQANGSQVTFDFGAGGNVFNRNGTGGTITIRIGELIGSAGSFLAGGNGTGTGQVLFQVGEKGVDSIFGGGVKDGLTKSALTKSGSAKLTLSGSNTFAGATNIDGGILEVSATGAITSSASLTIQGSGNYTFFNNGGSAVFTGNVALANSNFSPLLKVENGVFTAGSVSIGRGGSALTSEPAQGSTTAGIYVTGTSDIDITSGISINGSNSSGSARFDGGTVDVGGVVTIGLGNTTRWSVLDVNGAAFTSTEATTGIQIGSSFEGNAIFLIRDGTAKAEKITFNRPGSANLQGVARVNGGALYLGSGGMEVTGSNENFLPVVKLGNGLIGASANWSSTVPMQMLALGTLHAADPFDQAFNITLNGDIGGAGGFVKTGGGTLTIGGVCSVGGDVLVEDGTMEIAPGGSFRFTPTFDEVSNRIGGTGSLLAKGKFTIDLGSADDTVGNSWLLIEVATLTETFDDSFSVDGFTEDPIEFGKWTLLDGPILWVFREDTGELVAEAAPSSGGFTSWIADPAFGLDPADQGETLDPDKDGIDNLLEFILNGNPGVEDPDILPILDVNDTDFVFSFERRDDSLSPETTLVFQYGNDLNDWNNLTVPENSGPLGSGSIEVTDGSPVDTIIITLPKTEAGPAETLFGRLRASRP